MKKGFTLVEVMVTSIIMVIVLLGVVMYITVSARLNEQTLIEYRMHQISNLLDIHLGSDILKAGKVRYDATIPTEIVVDNIFVYKFDKDKKQLLRNDKNILTFVDGNFTVEIDDVVYKSYPDINEYIEVDITYTITAKNGLTKTATIKTAYKCRNDQNWSDPA